MAVVAGAPDRAGEHPRGHEAPLEAHEHLGGGADETVDGEDPRRVVVVGQPGEHPARVDAPGGGGAHGPGEHDLVEVAGVDPGDRLVDGLGPAVGGQVEVGELDRTRSLRRGLPVERLVGGGDGRVGRDRRDPGQVAAAADDDLGDHEDGLGARATRVGHRAEGDRSGARLVDVVADDRLRRHLAPPLLGLLEALRPARGEGGHPAPADEALALAHPRDDVAGVLGLREEREQVRDACRGDGDGADDESGVGDAARGGGVGGRRGRHVGHQPTAAGARMRT